MLKAFRTALRRIDGLIWRVRTRWRHRAAFRAKAAALAELDKAKRAHKSQRQAMRKAHDILRKEGTQ
jgi:hypothetical protein